MLNFIATQLECLVLGMIILLVVFLVGVNIASIILGKIRGF